MPENMSRSDSDMERGTGWVVAQGVIFVFFLIAVVFGDTVEDIPGLIFAQIVGLIIAISGAAVSVWALLQHGWHVSPFPKPLDGAHLVDTGPYRYVRHPMYTGIVIFTLGVGLAYANPVVLLSSVTFLVFFTAKTGREEEMLIARLDGYRVYRSNVPWRIIPFVV
jgi:protein-S-isoprenylcysteine O-methyltransferase Ste14